MLHDTLKRMSASLLHRRDSAAELIEAGPFTAEQHLQIHQNNVFISLTEALSAIYPVVAKLVGEDFFNSACREFIPQFPPPAAPMLRFGAEFADFLQQHKPAAALDYLADVARLEWAWHESFHAADAPPFNASILNEVPVEEHGNLKFTLHPAVRLLRSDYPVVRIWESNQDGFAGNDKVSLEEGPACVLLTRPKLSVWVHAVSPAEWMFLHALATDHSLDQAFNKASNIDRDFDLAVTLRDRVADQTLIGAGL